MHLDHINIVTPDLEEAVAFFTDVLGLRVGFRPDFPFPGAWLYGDADDVALVHLVVGEDTSGPTGALDHVAFRGTGSTQLIERLAARGIDFNERVVPTTGDRQIFFIAPFGLKIEVNFTAP